MSKARTSSHVDAMNFALAAARCLDLVELDRVIEAGERALAVGPILDPTLYRDRGQLLEQDLELLRAALPLWRYARERPAERSVVRSELAERLERARAARAARAAESSPSSSIPPVADLPATSPRASPEAPPGAGSPVVSVRRSRRGGPGAVSCSSCGAPVRWGTLPDGARIPCDLAPVEVVPFTELGSCELDPTWPRESILYRTVTVKRWSYGREVDIKENAPCGGVQIPADRLPHLARIVGYRPHIVSCPYAWQWTPHRGHNGPVDPLTGAPIDEDTRD